MTTRLNAHTEGHGASDSRSRIPSKSSNTIVEHPYSRASATIPLATLWRDVFYVFVFAATDPLQCVVSVLRPCPLKVATNPLKPSTVLTLFAVLLLEEGDSTL